MISKRGYARVWISGKLEQAHRIAFIEKFGDIVDIEGKDLHHKCGTKKCINPNHLLAVTRSEHNKIHYKDRIGFNNTLKTHCPKGHLLDGKNKRQRFCVICKKLHQNEYTERNREITNAKSRKWKQEHLEQHRAWNREYMRKRRLEAKNAYRK